MANSTLLQPAGSRPICTLAPVPPLFPWISDMNFSLIVPLVSFWAACLMYHIFDETSIFDRYKLHTSAEEASRNTVTPWGCLKIVFLNQAVQTVVGFLLGSLGEGDFDISKECHLLYWMERIADFRHNIARMSVLTGIDFGKLFGSLGGPLHLQFITSPASSFDFGLAQFIYWYALPVIRFGIACFVTDTWQYFTHRFLHTNQWAYRNIHQIHHHLYVPYHYGAAYTHPFENIALDTVSAILSMAFSGMSTREAMVYYAYLSWNAVALHSGYYFSWRPFEFLCDNDVYFHDIHHQRWGLKYNFGVTLTFWDRVLGTRWNDAEKAKMLYEQGRIDAENRVKKADVNIKKAMESNIHGRGRLDQ